MTARQDIIDNIEKIISGKNREWTIGITNDPDRRKEERGNPQNWFQWQADSEQDARSIEKHFLDKHMFGAPGGGESPDWVYIF